MCVQVHVNVCACVSLCDVFRSSCLCRPPRHWPGAHCPHALAPACKPLSRPYTMAVPCEPGIACLLPSLFEGCLVGRPWLGLAQNKVGLLQFPFQSGYRLSYWSGPVSSCVTPSSSLRGLKESNTFMVAGPMTHRTTNYRQGVVLERRHADIWEMLWAWQASVSCEQGWGWPAGLSKKPHSLASGSEVTGQFSLSAKPGGKTKQ